MPAFLAALILFCEACMAVEKSVIIHWHSCSWIVRARFASRWPFSEVGMVSIRQRIELNFEDGHYLQIPESLLVKYEDKTFLKIKATSSAIIGVVTGKRAPRNASFAGTASLTELVRLRNEAAWRGPQDSQEENRDSLFASSARGCLPVAKKRRVDASEHPFTVSIEVDEVTVVCLIAGQRPSKSDLCVQLEENMLKVVFKRLKADALNCLEPPSDGTRVDP